MIILGENLQKNLQEIKPNQLLKYLYYQFSDMKQVNKK